MDRAVVYHEGERISVFAATATDAALHVSWADARWDGPVPERAATVESPRGQRYRAWLAGVVGRLVANVEPVDGSVAVVARHEVLEGLARPLHRAWALSEVRELYSPDTIEEVLTNARPRRGSRAAVDDARVAAGVVVDRLRAAGRADAAHRDTVLFAEHFPGGARLAAHVETAVREEGARTTFVTSSPAALAAATEAGTRPLPLHTMVSRRNAVGAEVATIRARRRGRRLLRSLILTGGLLGLVPDASAIVDAERTTGRAWAEAASAMTRWTAVVDRHQPSVVVTSNFSGVNARALVLAAKERGTPSVYLQHAILFGMNQGGSLIHDRYLVWGERDRRQLLDRGVDPQDVTVVGMPGFTPAAPAPPAGPFTVAYLASRSAGAYVTQEHADAMRDAVVAATAAVGGTRLVIKVHPLDRTGTFDAIEAAHVEVVRGPTPLGVIAAAHAVVVATSTAGIEACAHDRPVIVLAPPGIHIPVEYEAYGAALVARDEADVIRHLCTLADGEPDAVRDGRRRLAADAVGPVEEAAIRAAQAILAAAR